MDTSTWQEVVWLFSVTQVAGMSGVLLIGPDIKKKTNREPLITKKDSWQVGGWAYRGAQLYVSGITSEVPGYFESYLH